MLFSFHFDEKITTIIMKFYVEPKGYRIPTAKTKVVYLIEDNWDDWFTYSTMYTVIVFDDIGNRYDIGSVKIGQVDMQKDQRRANLPKSFNELNENFFSLGESEYYYENLKDLGDEIRIYILKNLKDIAFDLDLFEKVKDLDVTQTSLMRGYSQKTIKGQFSRVAHGGELLTKFNFSYLAPSFYNDEELMKLDFYVKPDSNPPTNIHVIIGRNGVGKTRLIKNMIISLQNKGRKQDTGFFTDNSSNNELFSNIVCVAFSAFDDFNTLLYKNGESENVTPFAYIGLPNDYNDMKLKAPNSRIGHLRKDFVSSVSECIIGHKYKLWEKCVSFLESDPIFDEANVKNLKDLEDENSLNKAIMRLFTKLSSGHRVILLTISKLVLEVQEKTLVFLDEPEGHLHPPLLAAFVRALSELLITKNGVAIIATHSPVVLQEVPRSCAWKLKRSGYTAVSERLEIESFGENIGSLTREVFGYEVTDSGFHKMLKSAVDKFDTYEDVVDYFNDELGMEARGIVRALIHYKNKEE